MQLTDKELFREAALIDGDWIARADMDVINPATSTVLGTMPDCTAAETEAASRLFGILPDEQTKEFRCLWDEFEAAKTDDALFAKAIDRVQPVIANLETGGGTWLEYEVTQEQLNSRVAGKVNAGAPEVWKALSRRIDAWFAENL